MTSANEPVDSANALLSAAREAARNAYAPYSRFPVGAALLAEDGTIITGANVENASYGLTLCAERAAVARAVVEGHRRFQALAVVAPNRPQGAVAPCGACRQVMAEFMADDALVWTYHAESGAPVSLTMKALLPAAFDLGAGDTNSSTPYDPGPPR